MRATDLNQFTSAQPRPLYALAIDPDTIAAASADVRNDELRLRGAFNDGVVTMHRAVGQLNIIILFAPNSDQSMTDYVTISTIIRSQKDTLDAPGADGNSARNAIYAVCLWFRATAK